MKSRVMMLAASLALAGVVPASFAVAQQVPGTKSTAGIKSGAYIVDQNHTQVVAKFMHFGFNPVYIFFGEPSGKLTLDPAKISASKVEITIPLANLRTSVDKFTEHLKSPDFFDAAKYPAITFVSTSIKQTGPTEADITGNLTVHGVTRQVTIEADLVGQGTHPMSKAATVGFEGELKIKRSDFGVGGYVPLVGDEVELEITAAFEQKAG